MAGRVDRLERALALQVHLHTDVPDRLGGELLGVERQHVAHEPVIRLQQFRVGERNALLAVRLDREDAHLEDVAPGIFEQCRVLQFADDVLIDPTRLLGRQQFEFDLLAVNLHRKLVDVRAPGDREHEGAFQPRWVRVVELLVHRRDGDLVGDAGADLDVIHIQRGKSVRAGRRKGMRPRVRRDGRPRTRSPACVINNDQPGPETRECSRHNENEQNRQ